MGHGQPKPEPSMELRPGIKPIRRKFEEVKRRSSFARRNARRWSMTNPPAALLPLESSPVQASNKPLNPLPLPLLASPMGHGQSKLEPSMELRPGIWPIRPIKEVKRWSSFARRNARRWSTTSPPAALLLLESSPVQASNKPLNPLPLPLPLLASPMGHGQSKSEPSMELRPGIRPIQRMIEEVKRRSSL